MCTQEPLEQMSDVQVKPSEVQGEPVLLVQFVVELVVTQKEHFTIVIFARKKKKKKKHLIVGIYCSLQNNTLNQCCNNWLVKCVCKHHLNTDLLCKTTHHQCMKFQKGKSSYLWKLLERKNNTETIYSMIIELDAIPYCLNSMRL